MNNVKRLVAENARLEKERKELLQLVWVLVHMRGGMVVVPDLVVAQAVDERNKLTMSRDEAGNVVLHARKVEVPVQ